MKNIIIAGANGFVSGHVARYFANNNVNVLALDYNDMSNPLLLHDKILYLKCDISLKDSVKHALEFGQYCYNAVIQLVL